MEEPKWLFPVSAVVTKSVRYSIDKYDSFEEIKVQWSDVLSPDRSVFDTVKREMDLYLEKSARPDLPLIKFNGEAIVDL